MVSKEAFMAQAGDELISPVGERLLFCKTARDTNGELLEIEAYYLAHSSPPPEHYHPNQEERFQVISGEIRAKIGKQVSTYQAGDEFIVPAGVPHWMHNVSDEEGHVIWQTRPALKTEDFFETIWGLARDGKTNAAGVPNLLQVAVIAQEYESEFRLTKPPYGVQKVLFSVLAPIGRLLGYKAKYAKYSGSEAE
jgi:quercetin dioxygenase-like cupin family protein